MIGKLVVDYEEVSLGDLLEFLTDKGAECCVDGDNIYVYICQPEGVRKNPIIVKEKKIQNYFFKELTSPPTRTPTNYVQTWLLERLLHMPHLLLRGICYNINRRVMTDIKGDILWIKLIGERLKLGTETRT